MQHFSLQNVAYIDFDFKRPDRKSPSLIPVWTALRLTGLRQRGAICMERTRHGWHIIVPIAEKLLPAEMAALQMCMGDDRKRGVLNLMRAICIRKSYTVTPHWKKRWNILFSKKL